VSARKVARESLEDAFSAPSGPGRRGAGLASFLPPSRAQRPSAPAPAESPAPAEAIRPSVRTPEPGNAAPQQDDIASISDRSSETTQARQAMAASADTAPTEQTSEVAPTEPAPTKQTPEVAPTEPSRTETPADVANDAADAVENMPIYIDSTTLTALKAEKGRIGGTYADVAEAALDEHIDHVGEILQQGAANKSAGSSLPKRRKSPQIRGGIQVQLRFTKAQRDWLDEKVAEFGAPSRSVVVAVALQLQLGTRPS
jgi:hypothetical protein